MKLIFVTVSKNRLNLTCQRRKLEYNYGSFGLFTKDPLIAAQSPCLACIQPYLARQCLSDLTSSIGSCVYVTHGRNSTT